MTATDTADRSVEPSDRTDDPDPPDPDDSGSGDPDGPRGADAGDDSRDFLTYAYWAAFGILVLLAFVATFRVYTAASSAIRIWFSSDFVPIFQAAFNLVVLLACVIGISVLVRRMRS